MMKIAAAKKSVIQKVYNKNRSKPAFVVSNV